MNLRFKQVRTALNISQAKFGQQLGLRQSTINEIEHNRCTINERLIIAVCARFNVNENWFRTGVGNMFNTIDKKYNDFFDIYNKLSPPLQQFLYDSACNLLKIQSNL